MSSSTLLPTRCLSCHPWWSAWKKTIFGWHNLVIITSCDQQCKTIDCCVGQCVVVISLRSAVSWRMGAFQECWQSSAQSTCSTWWCADAIFLLLLLQSTKLIDVHCNNVDIASRDDGTKSLTNAFVAMAVTERPSSLQVLWHLFVMMKDHDWRNQFYCGRFGIFHNCWKSLPSHSMWQGVVIALHSICSPNAAYHCLAQCTWSIALVARGSLLFPAQLPSLARGL